MENAVIGQPPGHLTLFVQPRDAKAIEVEVSANSESGEARALASLRLVPDDGRAIKGLVVEPSEEFFVGVERTLFLSGIESIQSDPTMIEPIIEGMGGAEIRVTDREVTRVSDGELICILSIECHGESAAYANGGAVIAWIPDKINGETLYFGVSIPLELTRRN